MSQEPNSSPLTEYALSQLEHDIKELVPRLTVPPSSENMKSALDLYYRARKLRQTLLEYPDEAMNARFHLVAESLKAEIFRLTVENLKP